MDQVVQGFGTSNTGNVARRFFENPEKTAACTGVDVRLIRRLSVLLEVSFVLEETVLRYWQDTTLMLVAIILHFRLCAADRKSTLTSLKSMH